MVAILRTIGATLLPFHEISEHEILDEPIPTTDQTLLSAEPYTEGGGGSGGGGGTGGGGDDQQRNEV